MPFSRWTKAILPSRDDVDDVPGSLATIFDKVDSQFVQIASSVSDRDTKFAALPAGRIVVTTDTNTMWIKTSDTAPRWVSGGAYDTGWITSGFNNGPGWKTYDTHRARRYGPVVNIQIHFERNGADITTEAAPRPGNVSGDPVIAKVPASFIPRRDILGVGVGRWNIWGVRLKATTGEIVLASGVPGAVMYTGDFIHCDFTYIED